MKDRHRLLWGRAVAVLVVMLVATAAAGCAGSRPLPDCHGPWTPIPGKTGDSGHG
jgi:hypothetical protein